LSVSTEVGDGGDIGPLTEGLPAALLLRGWRERALLTQEQLAERSGLSVRTIRRLESGPATRRPHPSSIRMLAAALDLSEAEQAALAAAARWTQTEAAASDERPVPSGTAASSVPDGVPRQLPAPPPGFTGRVAELADLHRVRDAATVVITAIDGMAGIGKTALAVHAAHRLSEHYPDGQLFLDLHGYTESMAPVEPGDALERVLRALGVPGAQIPDGLDDRAALYRSRLADRKMLVVLDNAADQRQVTPLLPGTAGCLVMVTSRRRLADLDHTHTMSLDVLPLPDAVALFASAAGQGRVGGESAETLAEVVESCGRLPLALRIAAARLRSHPAWSLSHLIDGLRDHRRRLVELEAGPRSVTAALDLSYRELGPLLQRAYRLVGLHPGEDLDTYAVAALMDDTVAGAEQMVDRLLDAHLLQEPVPGRFRLHDLVRAHAAGRAARDETEQVRSEALARLFDYYARTTSLAVYAVYPDEGRPEVPAAAIPSPTLPDKAAAIAWLDTELPNLLASAHHAARHGFPDHTLRLSAVLNRYVRAHGRYSDAEALLDQALAVARATGNRVGEVDALCGIGATYQLQGRHELADDTHMQALTLARAIGYRAGELGALLRLGNAHRMHSRLDLAAERYGQALDIAREIGHESRELSVLNGLGWVYFMQGRYEEAIGILEQALQSARVIGNWTVGGEALFSLGHTHRQLRRHEQAITYFRQSLETYGSAGNRSGELNALGGIGWGYRVQGDYARAAEVYQQMVELAQQIGSRNYQFEAFNGMGRLHLAAGCPREALACHGNALDLATELGQRADEARAHDGLAHAHRSLGARAQAREHWERALEILTDLGVDVTEDEEATTAAIRAHLADLDEP
jgi:tetratricopeptide (TPR) repeat protein/transcriptional regulator with XRE-family HTH domain